LRRRQAAWRPAGKGSGEAAAGAAVVRRSGQRTAARSEQVGHAEGDWHHRRISGLGFELAARVVEDHGRFGDVGEAVFFMPPRKNTSLALTPQCSSVVMTRSWEGALRAVTIAVRSTRR